MKKLNNNFTSVEQSKHLMEIGVPVDSADCVKYHCYGSVSPARQLTGVVFDKNITVNNLVGNEYGIPCWSVGRLMEILGICVSYSHYELMIKAANRTVTPIDYMIKVLEDEMELGNIDFSKLEEE
jgi:hypothetical protein